MISKSTATGYIQTKLDGVKESFSKSLPTKKARDPSDGEQQVIVTFCHSVTLNLENNQSKPRLVLGQMSALRSCLICIGSFLIQMVVFGVANNFGLLYYHLKREFKGSNEETALVGSVATGLTFLTSPFANALLERYGFSIHMTLSTLLCVLSWFSSSYAQNLSTMIVTYSLLWGVGAGLANHAAMVSIQRHFSKRLSLANGIVMSGTGIGTLLLGPLIEVMINRFHFRWAFRMFSPVPLVFLVSVIAVLCTRRKGDYDPEKSSSIEKLPPIAGESIDSVMIRDREDSINTSSDGSLLSRFSEKKGLKERLRQWLKKVFDKELWTNKCLVIYIIGMSTFLFGYFIPFTFLVDYATTQGIDVNKAQFLIGLLSIASTVAKVLFGVIMDSQKVVRRSTVMVLSLYSMSLITLVIPFATHYWHYLLFSIVFGLGEGFFVGQLCAILVDFLPDKEKIGSAIANLFSCMSIAVMLGPVVASFLSTALHSQVLPFYIASGVSFTGASITAFIKLFERNTYTRSTSTESTRKMIT